MCRPDKANSAFSPAGFLLPAGLQYQHTRGGDVDMQIQEIIMVINNRLKNLETRVGDAYSVQSRLSTVERVYELFAPYIDGRHCRTCSCEQVGDGTRARVGPEVGSNASGSSGRRPPSAHARRGHPREAEPADR